MTERGCGWAAELYDAVALARVNVAAGRDAAVFLRRSARPSRRAVLHLHDARAQAAPADLARWYNERGFHFYVTDLDEAPTRTGVLALDAARQYLREADGIDAVILSARGAAAQVAARWCDARRAVRPVDALILANPDFGRARRCRLNIACPVLVISETGAPAVQTSGWHWLRQSEARLGQHVTWLDVSDAAGVGAAEAADPGEGTRAAGPDIRQRMFDEMGRWLGAYMYGQVRDQLL